MRKDYAGYLCLLNTIILFSTLEAVSKTLVGRVDAFQINLIRFLIGGLLLLIFVLVKECPGISKKDLAGVVIVGVTNVAVSMSLLQLSLYVPGAKASVVAVIFSSNPVFVTVFASLLDHEKIGLYKIIGLAAGVLGIVTIFAPDFQTGGPGVQSPLLALAASVTFALYTVLGRRITERIGSLKMNAYSFIAGSLVLLPFMLLSGKPVADFDYTALPQVLYLGFFVTGIAYLTYFKGLSAVGAGKGSMVFFMKPVLASIIAVIMLDEKITAGLCAGTVLVILSIFVIYIGKRK